MNKQRGFLLLFLFLANSLYSQNVGIGTSTPAEKLHVAGGNLRVNTLAGTGTRSVYTDPNGTLTLTPGTGAAALPVGTTAQQPASPATGNIRYNTTIGGLEYYNGATWLPLSSAGLADGRIWVGNASNIATAVTMSGDVAIDNAGAATIQDNSVDGTDIAITGNSNGSLMYYDGTDWVNLAPGTNGYVLRTNAAAAPTWVHANTLLADADNNDGITLVGTATDLLDVNVQNGLNIGGGATSDMVELGGPLVRNTTVTQDAAETMTFANTGSGAFSVTNSSTGGIALSTSGAGDITTTSTGAGSVLTNLNSTGDLNILENGTTALYVHGNNGAATDGFVGLGTTAPATRLEVNLRSNSATAIQVLSGNAANYAAYGLGRAANEFTIGVAATAGNYNPSTAAGDVSIRTENAANMIFFNNGGTNTTSGSPALTIGNNAAVAQAFAVYDFTFAEYLSTADNIYHTVQLAGGYGMTSLSIYANSYFDGDLRINGMWMGNLLTGGAITWRGLNGAVSAQGTNTGTLDTGADNQTHSCYCADGEIAVGFEAYATGSYLDGRIKLKCQALAAGFTTTSTGIGTKSSLLGPWNTGADDQTHWCQCPPGTYVKGISIRANSQLDGNMQAYCTGIKPN